METPIVYFYGICEKFNTLPIAEPLNVLTNLAFIGVAISLFHYVRTYEDLKGFKIYDIYALIFLILCIGVCSSIFHLFPSQRNEIIDTIPIVLFINIFFVSTVVRIAKCKPLETVVCYMAYAGFTHILVTHFPNALNDSIGYLSTMTALCVVAFYLNVKRRAAARSFLVAALLGVISLFFRSIDNAVCEVFPLGTHFLWHILNATLIYILMQQLIRNVNRRARMLRAASEHFA
jgi:Ceramidase